MLFRLVKSEERVELMETQPPKGNFSTILISALVTIILLGAVGFLTYAYIIPNLNHSSELIYGWIVKILPVVIIFLILLILLIAFPPFIPKETEVEDELELDRYTSPLYNLPLEDDYTYITPTLKPIEVEKPEILTTTKVPEKLTKGRSAALLFSDYPYPIKPGSEIAELLAPIEATEEANLAAINNTFLERLPAEIAAAQEFNYDLSLGRIGGDNPQALLGEIALRGLLYTEGEARYAILPFYSLKRSKELFSTLLERHTRDADVSSINVGLTSLSGRSVDYRQLLEENRLAFDVSKERGEFSIITYDDELAL